ncbi:hypothetical protein SDC9_171828 [bioreactor metagenome]|uniref:Uncharacterized protein n=1 Tax=bioreactor metagenome TaxID=1076179 RepID=A0A645GF71_9ZZZZ
MLIFAALALPAHAKGFCGVLQHPQLVPVCDIHNLIHIGHLIKQVYRQNSDCIGVNLFFDLVHINSKGFFIDIHKNGTSFML